LKKQAVIQFLQNAPNLVVFGIRNFPDRSELAGAMILETSTRPPQLDVARAVP